MLDDLNKEVHNDIEKIIGDLKVLSQISKLIKVFDIVFHLTSLIGIPYSYIATHSYFDTNVKEILNVLQASRTVDNSKAIKTLNWKPHYSGLSGFEIGIQEIIDWLKYETNLNKYQNTGYIT